MAHGHKRKYSYFPEKHKKPPKQLRLIFHIYLLTLTILNVSCHFVVQIYNPVVQIYKRVVQIFKRVVQIYNRVVHLYIIV